jgi:hemolysin-activating ACP:hemolysin acyltransferase|nr:MAG TPA: RTX toxin acyltransferase family [Caudoviricetes sp.]
MKAIELEKHSPSLDQIYRNIETANKRNEYKIFYPHWIYFSDECKLELIRQGFKVYQGEWLRGDYGFIIEW